jgi:hypothetical protein
MLHRISFGFVTVGMLSLAIGTPWAHAQGKGKPAPPPVTVTSMVHDFDGATPLALQSDGDGLYTSGADVISQIYSGSGDWALDLQGQNLRTVFLTLTPVGASPPSPVASDFYTPRLISRCFDSNGDITGFMQIPEGQSNHMCALRVTFSASGTNYVWVMSPLHAGTGWVDVACTSTNGGDCDAWTITPGAGANAMVANLYEIRRNGKEVFVGSYSNTFRIDLAK